jgi:hypothetical protein
MFSLINLYRIYTPHRVSRSPQVVAAAKRVIACSGAGELAGGCVGIGEAWEIHHLDPVRPGHDGVRSGRLLELARVERHGGENLGRSGVTP